MVPIGLAVLRPTRHVPRPRVAVAAVPVTDVPATSRPAGSRPPVPAPAIPRRRPRVRAGAGTRGKVLAQVPVERRVGGVVAVPHTTEPLAGRRHIAVPYTPAILGRAHRLARPAVRLVGPLASEIESLGLSRPGTGGVAAPRGPVVRGLVVRRPVAGRRLLPKAVTGVEGPTLGREPAVPVPVAGDIVGPRPVPATLAEVVTGDKPPALLHALREPRRREATATAPPPPVVRLEPSRVLGRP